MAAAPSLARKVPVAPLARSCQAMVAPAHGGVRTCTRDHPAFAGIAPNADFYFVHSYAGAPEDREVILAETEHGARFTAAVARGNLLGVQFHPERSGDDGLRLVANVVRFASEIG